LLDQAADGSSRLQDLVVLAALEAEVAVAVADEAAVSTMLTAIDHGLALVHPAEAVARPRMTIEDLDHPSADVTIPDAEGDVMASRTTLDEKRDDAAVAMTATEAGRAAASEAIAEFRWALDQPQKRRPELVSFRSITGMKHTIESGVGIPKMIPLHSEGGGLLARGVWPGD
jgi:hypothetical protein